MSEEDAALFWEMDLDPAPDQKSDSADPILLARATLTDEDVAPETMIPIGLMPTSEPDEL